MLRLPNQVFLRLKSQVVLKLKKIQAAEDSHGTTSREMGKTSPLITRAFINVMKKKTKKMNEGWSDKYKKSIDCNNPKGFSQRMTIVKERKRPLKSLWVIDK